MLDFLKTFGGMMVVFAVILILSHFGLGYSLQTV